MKTSTNLTKETELHGLSLKHTVSTFVRDMS